jgi:glycosyltransferase involved in cell wall biosynthesis
LKISVVIITFNSEDTLGKVLESVAWADEFVIVDSGSTDKTLQIASEFGAKVWYKKFEGYGSQKQFANQQASNDWILSLDDDEVVTPKLQAEIQEVTAQRFDYHGFIVPVTLVFLGKPMRFGGEYKRKHIRFFNKNFSKWDSSEVHEDIQVSGKIGTFKNQVYHYSYKNIADYFTKFNKYTSFGAESLERKGKKGSKLTVITRFPVTFLKVYLMKGAIFDGYPGFVWSLFSAVYPVVKYAKLVEKQSSKYA